MIDKTYLQKVVAGQKADKPVRNDKTALNLVMIEFESRLKITI
jgi:hypothetical protein